MQERTGDAYVEFGLAVTVREGETGTNGESSISIYTLSGVRWIAGGKFLCSTWGPACGSVMTWRDGTRGGRLVREGMCG